MQKEKRDKKTKKEKKIRDRTLDFVVCQVSISFVAVALVFALKLFGGQLYDASYNLFDEYFNQDTNTSQVLNASQTNAVLQVLGDVQPLSYTSQQTEKTTPVSKQELKNLNSICIPVSGRVTSEYSWRVHPISGKYLFHSGVDIAGNMGEDIKCALDGKVIERDTVGTETSYGKYIKVEHENGVVTLYGHCSKIINQVGDSVKKGQVIALVGSTGNSTGPHLHFEVRVNGQKLDPSLVADFV